MATEGKRGSKTGCWVAAVLVGLGGIGVLVLVGAVAGGWFIYAREQDTDPVEEVVADEPRPMTQAEAVAAIRGDDVKEQARALAALEREATAGNAKAMVMVAACYRAGLGAPAEDRYQAFEWHEKAAGAGEPTAMVEMARYYEEGVWVEASRAQSRQWLERAAAAGSIEAKAELAGGAP